jgi:hypothetical protein
MKRSTLLALGFAAMLTLSFGLSLADDPRASVSAGERSWRTAPSHSAGIAPYQSPSAIAWLRRTTFVPPQPTTS